MTEAVAILSLSVAIVALRVAVRARRDLVEYGTALDAGVIAGMRRDHFSLAHAFTEARKLVDVQDAELNAAQDAIEALRKSVGTHPAGASNAVSLHDLVQMLSRRADAAEQTTVRDVNTHIEESVARYALAFDRRLGDIEREVFARASTAGRGVKIPMQGVKPPAKKRAK